MDIRTLAYDVGYSSKFGNVIIALILVNAVVIGMETSVSLSARFGEVFDAINLAVLIAFIIEAALKIVGVAPRIQNYFRDPWNDFDFTIIVLSLIPATGGFATVARLARLMRVLRLVSRLQELRLIISTLLRSIPSIANVMLLLAIVFYIYGVMGFHLFHENSPQYWGTLGTSLLTLFRVVTLDSWNEVLYDALAFNPYAWIFFISFVLIGSMMIINLFIGVVLLNISEVKKEQVAAVIERVSKKEILDELRNTKHALTSLEAKLKAIKE